MKPHSDPEARAHDYAHNLLPRNTYVQPAYASETSPSEQTRIRWGSQAERWRICIDPGYSDPICHLIVLDLMMNTAAPHTIRANRTARLLREHRPDYNWTPQSVGRILTEISEVITSHLPEGDSTIRRRRDWKGFYWFFSPSQAGQALLEQMREWIGETSRPYTTDADLGRPPFVWMDFAPVEGRVRV